MALLTQSSNDDYHVNVCAWETPNSVEDDTLTSSQFYVTSKVEVTYQSKTPFSAKRDLTSFTNTQPLLPRKISEYVADHTFRCSYDSFKFQDLTTMISDMNLPFSLENNIQWRQGLSEPWIPLDDQNDLLNHLRNLAFSIVNTGVGKREFKFHIHIEKKIYLRHREYQALVQKTKDQEHVKNKNAAIMQETISSQLCSNVLLSRTELQKMLREKGVDLSLEHSSLEAMASQIAKKTERLLKQKKERLLKPVSIESLVKDDVKVTGEVLESIGQCAICKQEVELQSYMSQLPCSHMFHKDCIKNWLQNFTLTCPLCRYNLA